ncbi:acyl-CoA carboxylase subunit epsilon [Gordonia polyisoprenivorans]|uniref:acyl-CoA carboxylase subunit epsilon n=1 Tax=Gordonia polyisoprenivorans TaxID=84595 RepID=UPI001AD7BA22|nr:acyl-CoA carboxylase subunit epsilon [Gordonia polyisoprenivorans]QTI71248.1 acyl-CoA carboxylase subunit epsilon [Gordonia polyisoprenivorans]
MSASEQTGAESSEAPAKPFLTVVRGNPTDEDVAALVAVLAAASSGGGGEQTPAIRDDWGSAIDRLRPQWGGPGSFTNLRY